MIRFAFLALLSGVPALAYQVAWTRETALLAGAHIEAISTVLATFFGGLALGNRLLGPLSDRCRSPLLLFAGLEAVAGLVAFLSPSLLRALGAGPLAGAPQEAQLLAAGAIVFPATFALGGSLPALLRTATPDGPESAGAVGWIVGSNTAGAVVGVLLATLTIPEIGLQSTLRLAGASGLVVAALAVWLARRAPSAFPESALLESTPADPTAPSGRPPAFWLASAALAGSVTLAYEVLATRAAMLRLGSSLYAWAVTLGLFLIGLALGNWIAARRAARSLNASSDLAWIQLGSALLLIGAASRGVPSATLPASGVHLLSLFSLGVWIFPATLLMGAAFPIFARGALAAAPRVGSAFGSLTAANTAGGVAGSLLAPFVLIPIAGLEGGILICAAASSVLAAGFALRSSGDVGTRRVRAGLTLVVIALTGLVLIGTRPTNDSPQAIFLEHGRQASVAVLHYGGRRDLIVDGDPEASTFGNARKTEELLAGIPLLLHPQPKRFFEVGFGSGITLGSASRFALEKLDCVEISDSVLRAAVMFEPDNRAVASGRDARIRVMRGDGRAFLARNPGEYDIVVANTVHPWSVGATGLYSLEYFNRIGRALRSGGLAAQWIPMARLGTEHLGAILRTFYSAFEHGQIFWGADSLILVGSQTPIVWPESFSGRAPPPDELRRHFGLGDVGELHARRIASAKAVRRVLGKGLLLSDDRPVLELGAGSSRRRANKGAERKLVEELARAGAQEDAASLPLHLWLQSRIARDAGDNERADGLLDLAERAGFALAASERLGALTNRAFDHLNATRHEAAAAGFRRVLDQSANSRRARFGLAITLLEMGNTSDAVRELERLTSLFRTDAESWNLLASAYQQLGRIEDARRAIERALESDPVFPQALANAGRLAAEAGNLPGAEAYLSRLETVRPLGPGPLVAAVRQAIALARTRP
ncbi:MAG: tetratricopeptide repeat protein [bacterium]|nr:tetratricopeptide repeat protein [bacterium]